MKKLSKFAKINIYVFGVLSNIIPIIGLFVLEKFPYDSLHAWQFWAWICGAIYYIFVWTIGISVWYKLRKDHITLEERIKVLEERLGVLPVEEEVKLEKELKAKRKKRK